jgi:hypothetical protein
MIHYQLFDKFYSFIHFIFFNIFFILLLYYLRKNMYIEKMLMKLVIQ